MTVEIGCIKFPAESYLKQYWEANSESTLRFIELSKMGINGVVFDHQGKPISDASVSLLSAAVRLALNRTLIIFSGDNYWERSKNCQNIQAWGFLPSTFTW